MKYEYWFANIPGIGNKQKAAIRSQVKSAKELYYIEETALKKFVKEEDACHKILKSVEKWKLDAEYEKLLKKGAECITIQDQRYPDKLKKITSAPYAIYVKGRLPKEDQFSAAIVGARNCTPYGAAMAREFARELAKCNVQIISGMAIGIDGVSQRAAIEAGGTSFGVLGCGVDVCYPRENIQLYQELSENGGIISEQPLGMRPLAQFFPARNRLISALSDVVLVMEAKEKSGSLITADMALEQGKDVFALPGPVHSELSKGCHYLIKQGAGILISPKDFVEDLGMFHKMNIKNSNENKILLESEENIVYSCLDFEPKNLNQLCRMTGLSVQKMMDILVDLELRGYIGEVSKNYYVKVK